MHIGTPESICRTNNTAALTAGSGYEEDLFSNLIFRYEEPNGMSRWDSPLFTVIHSDASPPVEAIWTALVGAEGKGKKVKQHAATVQKPAVESNYLYDLDKTTQAVITAVVGWQRDRPGEEGGEVVIDGVGEDKKVELPAGRTVSLPQLQRLRRQFIGLQRQHTLPMGRVRELFVDFLNNSF